MCAVGGGLGGGGTKMNGKTMNVNVPSWWVSVGHCKQHDGMNVNVVPSLWVSVGHSVVAVNVNVVLLYGFHSDVAGIVVAVNVNVVLSLWVSVGHGRQHCGSEC